MALLAKVNVIQLVPQCALKIVLVVAKVLQLDVMRLVEINVLLDAAPIVNRLVAAAA